MVPTPKTTDGTTTTLLFTERDRVFLLIRKIAEGFDQESVQDAKQQLTTIFQKYLECPTLLDGSLEAMVVQLCEQWMEYGRSEAHFAVLYSLCIMRGQKVVQRFFPHALSTIRPVWEALQAYYNGSVAVDPNQRHGDGWKTAYCLWLWMGVLSLIPFGTDHLLPDSGCSHLIDLAQTSLQNTGAIREAVAVAISSWLVRPDWETERLSNWIVWASNVIQSPASSEHFFLRLGVLQVMVLLLKKSSIAKREILTAQFEPVSTVLKHLATSTMSSTLLDHYLVKWFTRWSCWHLPAPAVSQRQSPGNQGGSCCSNPEDENVWEIPIFIEEYMDHLLRSLQHPATPVRWSAAKGIGRIASRLPLVAVEDILEAILSAPIDHGSCLALAELARRRLVSDVSRLPLQRIVRHPTPGVRDAACYLYWALCRSYPPDVLAPFLPSWNTSMIVTALLDREINCRRAAAAAFQEAVGRQGARNVPFGLEILTSADYFSLGNRCNAYTVVAFQVAKLSEFYRRAILRQLYTVQLFHSDVMIRSLSSKALYYLTELDIEHVTSIVIPNLLEKCFDADVKIRHGSVLGIADCILALTDCGVVVSDTVSPPSIHRLIALIPELEQRRLYRGRGGEHVRFAVCKLIKSISKSSLALTVKDQVRLLDSLDGQIPHPNEDIQQEASIALHSLLCEYFPVGPKGPSDRLQKRVVDTFVHRATSATNPSVARGYSMALGAIPTKLVAPNERVLSAVLECLYKLAKPSSLVCGEGDAETRRNALQALSKVVKIIVASEDKEKHALLTPTRIERILKAFGTSMDDYKSDRRGDVGSWCRIEAMTGFVRLLVTSSFLQVNRAGLESVVTVGVKKIVRQLCEKLDTVRKHAGECMKEILSSNEVVFSEKGALSDAIGLLTQFDLRDTKGFFAHAIQAVKVPTYSKSVLEGFACSIGGLSESPSRLASDTLVGYIKDAESTQQAIIAKGFVELLVVNCRVRTRLTIPLIKTMDCIVTNGCFSCACEQNAVFMRDGIQAIHLGTRTSDNIPQLLGSVDVFTAIAGASSDGDARRTSLAMLCGLLVSSYPRVRAYACDHMVLLDISDHAVNQLLEVSWVSETMSTETAKSHALEVSKTLGVDALLTSLPVVSNGSN